MFETQRKLILINGQPPAEPQFLDADGKWIKKPDASNIHYLEFDFSKLLPFNALPLK